MTKMAVFVLLTLPNLISRKIWVTEICLVYTVWKLQNFFATVLSQKFRESNFFTKEIYSTLIWRKNFCMAVKFSFCAKKMREFHYSNCDFPMKSKFWFFHPHYTITWNHLINLFTKLCHVFSRNVFILCNIPT